MLLLAVELEMRSRYQKNYYRRKEKADPQTGSSIQRHCKDSKRNSAESGTKVYSCLDEEQIDDSTSRIVRRIKHPSRECHGISGRGRFIYNICRRHSGRRTDERPKRMNERIGNRWDNQEFASSTAVNQFSECVW